ncbi:MAG: MATE family efflux transporter [Clostridia bacterium]|nr:MATE family efflux transporter [Clostridia bacterium]
MKKLLFGDKSFYISLVSLAMPIALQNFISSALNLVDTVMIGQLGEAEIAAVALANQIFFLLILFLFGISSGAGIFHAQFWGKGDVPNIRKVLGISLVGGISVALLFTIASLVIPRELMGLFSQDTRVIHMGSAYLRIVSLSFIMTAVSFCYSFTLRCTGKAGLPTYISFIALIANTLLNYVLIFGVLGFPSLGVEGAAIATVIARVVEMVLMLVIVYGRKLVPAASFKEMLDFDLSFVKRFLNTTTPVILNEILWSVGITMYTVAYGRMGTGVLASINIASTVERIALVLFMGMANACAVLVGNKIGEGDEKTAFLYAKRLIVLGPLTGIVMGGIVIGASDWILSIYKVSEVVYNDAKYILMIFGLLIAFKIFNMINVVGILRSGGDTTFCLIMDTAGIWLIAVPLAFIGGLVWSLPVYIVYLLVNLEEVFKIALGIPRFISGKWINNLVKHM